jgi:hypothetical protein
MILGVPVTIVLHMNDWLTNIVAIVTRIQESIRVRTIRRP